MSLIKNLIFIVELWSSQILLSSMVLFVVLMRKGGVWLSGWLLLGLTGLTSPLLGGFQSCLLTDFQRGIFYEKKYLSGDFFTRKAAIIFVRGARPGFGFNSAFIFAFFSCIYLQGAHHAGTSIIVIYF